MVWTCLRRFPYHSAELLRARRNFPGNTSGEPSTRYETFAFEQNMVRAVELGCERTWRRADWRARLAIAADTPCLGVLLNSLDDDRSVPLHGIAQELRWTVPGIRIGLLDVSRPAMDHSPPYRARRVSDTGWLNETANDPMIVLEWVCGVDVWLILDDSPLANALQDLSHLLRIPCLGLPAMHGGQAASSHRQAPWLATAEAIAESFQKNDSHALMLAFRNPNLAPASQSQTMTVDLALQTLRNAIDAPLAPTRCSPRNAPPRTLRPAA